MQRIKISDLENAATRLNELLDRPLKPWIDRKVQIGNFHISQAYGGCCVHEMVGPGGGIRTPIMHGHVSKRECYDALQAFIAGATLAK
tara:strand:+ start:2224 stop:2487 length:264 start_codon:yes stop_codon:yes gene_type:complete